MSLTIKTVFFIILYEGLKMKRDTVAFTKDTRIDILTLSDT